MIKWAVGSNHFAVAFEYRDDAESISWSAGDTLFLMDRSFKKSLPVRWRFRMRPDPHTPHHRLPSTRHFVPGCRLGFRSANGHNSTPRASFFAVTCPIKACPLPGTLSTSFSPPTSLSLSSSFSSFCFVFARLSSCAWLEAKHWTLAKRLYSNVSCV